MSNHHLFPDIQQLMAEKPHFSPPQDQFFGHRNLTPQTHYESIMGGSGFPHGMADFGHDCTTVTNSVMENGFYGNEGGNSRWPRQETLTLLEIRSLLDSKFKEANHKGPLWDEVSRIMSEEHGYQRSGKKCREKFENLYKYYKKTKVGKSGRQDGKNYRFFRQLEAIYGETSNQGETLLPKITSYKENLEDQKLYESLSFSNSTEIETSSCSESHNNDLSAIVSMNQSSERISMKYDSDKRVKRSWKLQVKEHVEMEMRKIIETQEAWMEKMMKTIERKEEERMFQEDEWRKQEIARCNREHELWAKKRAWIEARDAALLDSLKKHSGKSLEVLTNSYSELIINKDHTWTEHESSSLVQLITSNGGRFEENCYLDVGIWEGIAAKMGSLGYDLSVAECKEKWEDLSLYVNMTTGCSKKIKEDMKINSYLQQLVPYYGLGHGQESGDQQNVYLPSQLNVVSQEIHDSHLNILMMNEGEFWWQKYGLQNKTKNSH